MPNVGVFASVFDENNLPNEIHPWNVKRINDAYKNKVSELWIFWEK